MAKFDEMWPDIQPLEMSPDPKFESMMCGREQGDCFWCNNKTFWLEINFESHICSPPCEKKVWEDYWRVSRGLKSSLPNRS